MELGPHSSQSREFLFHSVVSAEGHTKYYNIYKLDEEHFYAECHHFNRERSCEGDFELHKEGVGWVAEDKTHEEEAQQIGGEIDRMMYQRTGEEEGRPGA